MLEVISLIPVDGVATVDIIISETPNNSVATNSDLFSVGIKVVPSSSFSVSSEDLVLAIDDVGESIWVDIDLVGSSVDSGPSVVFVQMRDRRSSPCNVMFAADSPDFSSSRAEV